MIDAQSPTMPIPAQPAPSAAPSTCPGAYPSTGPTNLSGSGGKMLKTGSPCTNSVSHHQNPISAVALATWQRSTRNSVQRDSKTFIREEVARQLSLLPHSDTPTAILPRHLQQAIIRTEICDALPTIPPLTHALRYHLIFHLPATHHLRHLHLSATQLWSPGPHRIQSPHRLYLLRPRLQFTGTHLGFFVHLMCAHL
ncbi:hypothetical protein HPB51_014035 [Rhipicephalus microplus]|uniref:Uncharacterized protein n=1 Tax=Rhipicephalus microplus TaxID=6941 RepID=A0A9J6DAM0_RHIMP|nr:hypothetical protein HPB51_014035 [Rhipicephalus microplus]